VVVQPAPLSNGKPEIVDETKVTVNDAPAQSIQLEEGANVDELIKGLHAIGATSHDIISILQAIKAAGGLRSRSGGDLMSDLSAIGAISGVVTEPIA
jgi:flagellar P-ring protein FlgI